MMHKLNLVPVQAGDGTVLSGLSSGVIVDQASMILHAFSNISNLVRNINSGDTQKHDEKNPSIKSTDVSVMLRQTQHEQYLDILEHNADAATQASPLIIIGDSQIMNIEQIENLRKVPLNNYVSAVYLITMKLHILGSPGAISIL